MQSFPIWEANFLHPPTALRVGGEQIIMVQRQFSACVLKLSCDQEHGDPAVVDWSRSLRCAPAAAKSLFLHPVLTNNYKEEGSEGIVMAELWFHLARLGTPGGTSYSVLLFLSQIAEEIVSWRRADIESQSEQWPKCQLHRCQAQFKGSKQQIDRT